MKNILIVIVLFLSSCQFALQPFPPSVSKAETQAAFDQVAKALQVLDARLAAVEPKQPSKEAKK